MDLRGALSAVAAGLLAVGSGCMTPDAAKNTPKKPDVTQPGVLPPPQETMKPANAVAPSGVIPAGGVQTGQPGAGGQTPVLNANNPSSSPLSKLIAKTERKVPAKEMAVAWRNRIAYLPDPTRNGAMGAGLAGQLFLYGGSNLEFALADGTLTVDLVDETPRPPGQAPVRPERWQFDKYTLRNLRTVDETFGKSYVLFLPWPAYRADITRVRIAARYDPDNGQTLYATPSVVTIDTSGPLGTQVFDGMSNTLKPMGGPGAGGLGMSGMGMGGMSGMGVPGAGPVPFTGLPANPQPNPLPMNPIPLGAGPPPGAILPPGASTLPAGGSVPIPLGSGYSAPPASGMMPAPMMPIPPGAGMPMPAPTGGLPAEPLPPLGITIPSAPR